MNKQANMSPAQMLMLSLLGGAGTFGATRLLQDAMRSTQPKEEIKDSRNELGIDIPTITQPGHMKAANTNQISANPGFDVHSGMESVSPGDSALLKLLAVPLGFGGGFMGSKMLYDKYQHGRMDNELDETKKRYMQALQQAKIGSASETPYVDGFCELIKDALFDDNHAPYTSFPGALWGVTPGSEAISTAAKLLLLGSGVGTFGGMYMADQKRRKAEQDKQYPERVELNSILTHMPPQPGM